jgi:hypothetical protein
MSNKNVTVKNMKLTVFVLGILFFLGCKKENASYAFQEIKEYKKIKLNEKDKPIGNVISINITQDSLIYLLDMSASDIKCYDMQGEWKGSIGGKGKGPNQLLSPRSMCIDERGFFVGDVGFLSIKRIDRSGQLISMIQVEGYRPTTGDMIKIDNDKILTTGLWDGRYENQLVVTVIDTTGKIVNKFGKMPTEYSEYKTLSGGAMLDVNKNGEFVISFDQSPALVFGNVSKGVLETWSFQEKKSRYLDDLFKKENLTIEELDKVNLKIMYNTRIKFLNDSVIVRSHMLPTEKALKQGSSISANHFIEFYTKEGRFLGESSIKGQMRAVFNNSIVVEESDDPDNRQICFYHVIFKSEN